MDAQQQIASLRQVLVEREEQIAQLELEAQGAALAVQNAQAEAAAASQNAQRRAEMIERLGVQVGNSHDRIISPSESVLKKLQTPNILRDLPCYDGNPIKLHQFLRAIDNIMPVIEEARGTQMYQVWIQCIRSKITGDADTVLELYGTELSWNDIKSNLVTHYNDKRDEVSLTRDLFKSSQQGTVEEFYGKISHIISLLLNQLGLSETNVDVKASKKKYYQDIGLKVFLAGLKEPLGPIIRAQTPGTLKEALRLCIEEGNYNYVKNPFKTHTPPIPPKPPQQSTSYPQQKFPHFPRYQPAPFPQFKYPQNMPIIRQQPPKPLQHNFYPSTNPFKMQTNQFRMQPNSFRPNLPNPFRQQPSPNTNVFAPRNIPQPKPTPMEVDSSIRSRNINYMNRPHFHLQSEPFDYGQYSQFNEYDYDYYPYPETYENPQMQPIENDPIDSDIETREPTAENKEKIEQQNVDDLNFQLVGESAEMT